MRLSLPKWFSVLILASAVCKSLQCLISAVTQGGEGSYSSAILGPPPSRSLIRAHLFSRAVGREEHCKQMSLVYVGSARSVLATLGLPLLTVCVLSQSTLLRLQVALQGNCLKWALGCVHFPGLSHSGAGSRVLHKGTDSVGPAFHALSRSEQLR